MAEEKHSSIRRTLEKNIRQGNYYKCLPSIRVLAREFDVSLQTMSKALRPLKQSGLLTTCPAGTIINGNIPYQFPNKSVTLVVNGQFNGSFAEDPLLSTLRDEMQRDNITPHLLQRADLENTAAAPNENMLKSDGYLFLYQSYSMASVLPDLNRVPFLVGNRLTGDPGVHWIDFDWKKQLFDLVKILLDRGYKKIAYIANSQIADFHYEAWLDVCASYNIFNYTAHADDFRIPLGKRLEKIALSAAGKPEILLLMNVSPESLQKELSADLWNGTVIVVDKLRSIYPIKNCSYLRYSSSTYEKLGKAMWQLFKSIANHSAGPPRGHWVQGEPMHLES